jgi:hypothetical protein
MDAMGSAESRWNRFAGTLCATLVCLFGAGCDGVLRINGQVISAPGLAESVVYIDEAPPHLVRVVPVTGATVRVVENPDFEPEESALRRQDLTTDASGRFYYFSVTCPCEFDVGIDAAAEGYKPLSRRFTHDPERDHTMTIVLAIDEERSN